MNRLKEIKARAEGRMELHSDTVWLIAEVERLRENMSVVVKIIDNWVSTCCPDSLTEDRHPCGTCGNLLALKGELNDD